MRRPLRVWWMPFSSDLIRLYKGHDLVGTELGAAAKNVIGIAAGMLDGRGLSSMKGALMARGAREVARLIHAMGGSELSAYGLCHLGDYEATLFSVHSHNRRFGESFIRGQAFHELAEGVPTAKKHLSSWGLRMKWNCPSAGRYMIFCICMQTPTRRFAGCSSAV